MWLLILVLTFLVPSDEAFKPFIRHSISRKYNSLSSIYATKATDKVSTEEETVLENDKEHADTLIGSIDKEVVSVFVTSSTDSEVGLYRRQSISMINGSGTNDESEPIDVFGKLIIIDDYLLLFLSPFVLYDNTTII